MAKVITRKHQDIALYAHCLSHSNLLRPWQGPRLASSLLTLWAYTRHKRLMEELKYSFNLALD